MSKKPNGKRLNEHQRCEILSKLSKTNAPNKRALAQDYSISEGAIRKVWDIQEAILERSALLYEEAKERTFQASVGRFTELEDMLYIWIDSILCQTACPVISHHSQGEKHCFQSFHSGIRIILEQDPNS
jgi:hypothetical protein